MHNKEDIIFLLNLVADGFVQRVDCRDQHQLQQHHHRRSSLSLAFDIYALPEERKKKGESFRRPFSVHLFDAITMDQFMVSFFFGPLIVKYRKSEKFLFLLRTDADQK